MAFFKLKRAFEPMAVNARVRTKISVLLTFMVYTLKIMIMVIMSVVNRITKLQKQTLAVFNFFVGEMNTLICLIIRMK